MLLEEMLAHLGYEAVGFRETDAALNALAQSADRFDLAVVDESVIGSGWQDLRQRLRAELPVLLIAERGSAADERGWCDSSGEELEKPLRMEALAMALARHIQKKTPAEPQPASGRTGAVEAGIQQRSTA
ncbi:MAG TPA: hypothetical protein VGO17_06485 [Aurantimonas sp.]|nr:hypothetical protein [Aurantimonas sp.]